MPSDELSNSGGKCGSVACANSTHCTKRTGRHWRNWPLSIGKRLGREGHLAGTPRLAIERTIEDARNVLSSGREALALVLQQAGDPEMVANPDLDIPGRLRAVIRLYADTPNDMRNRCQRLTAWLTAIAQAQQRAGETPLTARIIWPHTLPQP